MEDIDERVTKVDRSFLLHLLQRPRLHEEKGEKERWKAAYLPISMGGLGLRDIAEVRQAAYIASWTDSLRSVANMEQEWAETICWMWRSEEGKATPQTKGLGDCITWHARILIDMGMTPGGPKCVERMAGYHYPGEPLPVRVEGQGEEVRLSKIQTSITMRVHKRRLKYLLEEVSVESQGLQIALRASQGGKISNGWIHDFDYSDLGISSSEHVFSGGGRITNTGMSAEEYRVAIQIRLDLSDAMLNALCERFRWVICTCGRKLTTGGYHHLLSCPSSGFSERHDGIVRILVRAARQAGLMTRGDKQSPPIGPFKKLSDMEITCAGETRAYDIKVVSGHSEKYDLHLLRRCYPISVETEERQWNFMAARDDQAVCHIARVEKIREYTSPNWNPVESTYVPMDKEILPEERRPIRPTILSDPSRAGLSLTPIVIQVGGTVAPETDRTIRSICRAWAEYKGGGKAQFYESALNKMRVCISNTLMRTAARNIIRMRALIKVAKHRQFLWKPDAEGTALSDTPSGWIPADSPIMPSSLSLFQKAKQAPKLRCFQKFKIKNVRVHYTPLAPPGLNHSPNSPISSSSSSSSSSHLLSILGSPE
jgi:hypothetical protein